MPPSSVTNEFVMNYACTIPINDIGQEPKLTASEFWRGLRRGGHDPTLFVDYVAKSEILPGSKSDTEFKRRLTMADGAVHTGSGATIDQDCRNVTGLCTEATTIGSAAKSTMLLSHGGRESDSPDDIYLSAVYELRVPEVEAGSQKAKEIEENYTLLAKGAAKGVIEKIRGWKINGTIDG